MTVDLVGAGIEGLAVDCVGEEAIYPYWREGLGCYLWGRVGVGVGFVFGWAEVIDVVSNPGAGVEGSLGGFGAEEKRFLELWAGGDYASAGVGHALGEEEGFDDDELEYGVKELLG
jgi:hypothetical protein